MANKAVIRTKIRKDDVVVVIAGDEKGRTGRVIRIFPTDGKVLVEGVNMVKRHVRATADRPGQIMEKEAPLHLSNVAIWNEAEGRRVRPCWQVTDDGSKVRVDRRSGESIGKP